MSIIVTSKRSMEIPHPTDPAVKCAITNGFLGKVPDWVLNHWMFQAAVRDHTVTYVGDVPSAPVTGTNAEDEDDQGGEDEAAAKAADAAELTALREKAKSLGVPNWHKLGKAKLLKAIEDAEQANAGSDDTEDDQGGEDTGDQEGGTDTEGGTQEPQP